MQSHGPGPWTITLANIVTVITLVLSVPPIVVVAVFAHWVGVDALLARLLESAPSGFTGSAMLLWAAVICLADRPWRLAGLSLIGGVWAIVLTAALTAALAPLATSWPFPARVAVTLAAYAAGVLPPTLGLWRLGAGSGAQIGLALVTLTLHALAHRLQFGATAPLIAWGASPVWVAAVMPLVVALVGRRRIRPGTDSLLASSPAHGDKAAGTGRRAGLVHERRSW